MTHFEIFGLPASVDLDVKALEQTLRTKLLEVHPDRLATADAATRRKAADLSASLNEAVKVLRDPVRRAFYVLKLRGVDLESEQAAAKLADDPRRLVFLRNLVQLVHEHPRRLHAGQNRGVERLNLKAGFCIPALTRLIINHCILLLLVALEEVMGAAAVAARAACYLVH
jgi:molecular chaperone HscB